ncbi:uncharacterized protein N7515_002485 [Penicillium bovifimosum]|uniref:Ricin B lectin domain-containing protein n=1 Tax=Penicillium bovifimosum TaxID=126998 RepID=A0A9W9HBR6_9EURO|nr:uncharacterized protein N7515_002485 [Penicillium bovifimosum]KAJ5143698.1 hypothetical protein N7515_002485 [Penicillium bovifimosum]
MKLSTIITFAFASAASAQYQYYRITAVESDTWLKTFPGEGAPLVLDNNFASLYERWTITPQDGGYVMKNEGTNTFISCDEESCKSAANPTVFNVQQQDFTHIVLNPSTGLVWTASGGRIIPAENNGSPEQRFTITPDEH